MADNGLAGVRVLVTRPGNQAQALVDAIEAAGGTALRFPVIEIEGRDPGDVAAMASELSEPDIALFVSANAVRFGAAHAGSTRVAAIGPATTRELEQRGHDVAVRSADGFDSEHLLATRDMQQVAGKVVRIIRGNGGRELLADTLRERGATVEYLEVYTRRAPDYPAGEIAALGRQLAAGDIGCITIMSVESLVNFLALLPSTYHDALLKTLLVTPAARVIIEAEKRLPGTPATQAHGPGPGDMVAAIVAGTNPGHPHD